MTSEPMNDSVHGHHHGWCDKCLVEGVHRATTPAPRENGWEELRRLAEKATPGPWRHGWDDGSGRAEATEGGSITLPGETVIEGQEVVAGGRDSWGIAVGVRRIADADYIAAVSPDVVLRLLAAARGEPEPSKHASREFGACRHAISCTCDLAGHEWCCASGALRGQS